MSESKFSIPEEIWERAVRLYRAALADDAARAQMDRHFPQFLSHDRTGSFVDIEVLVDDQVDLFSKLYADPLARALEDAGLPHGTSVRFIARGERPASVPFSYKTEEQTVRFPVKPAAQPAPAVVESVLPLNPSYTFANFVRGPSNSFAHATATAVAKGLGLNNYNPLFIYGGTGLGKTHLMEAIGNQVKETQPGKSVCYITAETFLNKYTEALMNDTVNGEFRRRFRHIDLLLMDDVQFIAGKKQVQEEFFNTFNQLMIYNKQIVMTSDVSPKELQNFEERLTSRFQQGMVVEIESPSYETRLAIVKMKAKAFDCVIPDDILRYIVENIRSHVRALEGALSIVAVFIQNNPDVPLTTEVAHGLLKNLIDREQTIKSLSPAEIIRVVAETFGVTVPDIVAGGRMQPIVTPRQIAMYLSTKLTTNSLHSIGEAFGKNHSTVFHGSKTIQQRIETEPELKKTIEAIVVKLGRSASDAFE